MVSVAKLTPSMVSIVPPKIEPEVGLIDVILKRYLNLLAFAVDTIESPLVLWVTSTLYVPTPPPERPTFIFVSLIVKIFNSYIFPVELERKTFTAEASVPNRLPTMVMVDLRAGFEEDGLRDEIVGAVDAPST